MRRLLQSKEYKRARITSDELNSLHNSKNVFCAVFTHEFGRCLSAYIECGRISTESDEQSFVRWQRSGSVEPSLNKRTDPFGRCDKTPVAGRNESVSVR